MKINAAAVSLAAMACAGWVKAADWPQWRGPNRNGHVPAGERVLTNLHPETKPRWQITIGEGFASPVVVNGGSAAGRIFYSDLQAGKEVVHAAEAATGKELWQSPLTWCSPAYADGCLYVRDATTLACLYLTPSTATEQLGGDRAK